MSLAPAMRWNRTCRMSSKHTRYVRQIDAVRITNQGGTVVFSAGGGGGTPVQTQVAASDVFFAPAGNVQAGNVQGAIEELDAEKLGLAGGTMTGILILADMLPDQDHEAASKWYVDNLDHLLVPDAAGVPVVRLLPDFVRIGHPLQPGLTWTPEQGLQVPASCIVGNLAEYVWYIESFSGLAGILGQVFYTDVDIRVSKVAIYTTNNELGETSTLTLMASTNPVGFNEVDSRVIGRIDVDPGDMGLTAIPDEEVYDGDTGESVTSGVNRVVTGDDPLILAGSWIVIRAEENAVDLYQVTVTMLGRRV